MTPARRDPLTSLRRLPTNFHCERAQVTSRTLHLTLSLTRALVFSNASRHLRHVSRVQTGIPTGRRRRSIITRNGLTTHRPRTRVTSAQRHTHYLSDNLRLVDVRTGRRTTRLVSEHRAVHLSPARLNLKHHARRTIIYRMRPAVDHQGVNLNFTRPDVGQERQFTAFGRRFSF